jgi:hypothetical protein
MEKTGLAQTPLYGVCGPSLIIRLHAITFDMEKTGLAQTPLYGVCGPSLIIRLHAMTLDMENTRTPKSPAPRLPLRELIKKQRRVTVNYF